MVVNFECRSNHDGWIKGRVVAVEVCMVAYGFAVYVKK